MSPRESGYGAYLLTMGGRADKSFKGRVSERRNGTLSSTTPVLIASENQNRLNLWITNTGSQAIKIFLGGDNTGGTFHLEAGGSMQLDSLLSWSGVIYGGLAAAGSATYDGGEIWSET